MNRTSLLCGIIVAATAACSQSVVGGGTTLERYDVELREKVNTCAVFDPQVSRDTIFIERHGTQGVLHLGAELSFPVKLDGPAVTGSFLEADHTSVEGRHVVCKRLTTIDLSIKDNTLSGNYDRKRRQECLLEAKPCFITWSVTGTAIVD